MGTKNLGTTGSGEEATVKAEAEDGKGPGPVVQDAAIAEGDKPIDEQNKDKPDGTIVEGADTKTTLEAGLDGVSDKIVDKDTGKLSEESLDKTKEFVGSGELKDGDLEGEFVEKTEADLEMEAARGRGDPRDDDNLIEHPGGVLRRKEDGKVAYAPPGTYNAAMAGMQQDASGHFESVGHTNSDLTATRV